MDKQQLLDIFKEMDEYLDDINFRLERLGDEDNMEVFFLTELIKDAEKLVKEDGCSST